MMRQIAELHKKALPHTLSSRLGIKYLQLLYALVSWVGFVKTVSRGGKIVGAISYIGPLILTLVVEPVWQRKGIGRELLGHIKRNMYVYTERCTVSFYEKVGFVQIGKVLGIYILWRK